MPILTHNLGYPRIGDQRQLKKACEAYWAGRSTLAELLEAGTSIRKHNWLLQQQAGIDLIPSNDFSLYDQVLDLSLMVGAIPERYHDIITTASHTETDLYFAMARGYQKKGLDVTAMEMTKWFDTNYHYMVPEFLKNQTFHLFSTKPIREFAEAKRLGILTKPVLIGPVSYLLLGKEKEKGFHRLDLLERLLPVYVQLLESLEDQGAQWVQLDEPFLSLDLSEVERQAFQKAYQILRDKFPRLQLILATYFDCMGDNLPTGLQLPVDVVHLDLIRCPSQLDDVLKTDFVKGDQKLSLGIVDGRNIWKNEYDRSLSFIRKATEALGEDRLLLAPSCSLLHVPCDLEREKEEEQLTPEIKNWMAFAKQKIYELIDLRKLTEGSAAPDALLLNREAWSARRTSNLIHKPHVKQRLQRLTEQDAQRMHPFSVRREVQRKALQLPLFPTTTIGSFPQTQDVRSWRAKYRRGEWSVGQYESHLKEEILRSIRWQEQLGIDVLVHGEFERNDMVEYFGEQLSGYVFTQNGWVQSYGSRCVKPPVIYGDVERPQPMTVRWTAYAQSCTDKPMKGMLTGPVTVLQWSFVRNDQPRETTAMQLALAIRDEVADLEKAGIRIIQIDEPAIREGLPVRKAGWKSYLEWATRAFRISASVVKDETQIHTHMCYSEFNDIIESIASMDADVITIETSRSQMELLDAFVQFRYPNEIGPGVYDIHSPRIPLTEEIVNLLQKALEVIPAEQLWVNPDCGLKTRHWEETEAALRNMVGAAQVLRGTLVAVR